MGSRIRENVKHFFECFCEVVPATVDKDAWIIQQYPDKYKDEEVLKSVPKFAYPYKFEKLVVVEKKKIDESRFIAVFPVP
jgi:hypothetical protein